LKNLNVEDSKTLFVTTNSDHNTLLSSRNIKNTKVITADKLNTYDILNSGKLVISEKAVDQIDNHFNS
jgi:large subunit ribosomal protein L4